MYKISIPKPCHQGWENMQPDKKGRYCNSCAKTVVDFSVMSDEAVQHYLIINAGQKICGHFKNSQVERIIIELPQNIFRISLPIWKKFLVVFLICFGSSFLSIDTAIAGTSFTQGEPIYDTTRKTNNIKSDTSKNDGEKKKSIKRILPKLMRDDKLPENGLVDGFIFVKLVKPSACDTSLNADTVTLVKNNTPLRNSKKGPSPKTSSTDRSFILPETLAVKRPFSKKKKA